MMLTVCHSWTVSFLIGCLLVTITSAEEECLYGKINCYECSSETNKGCADPFNSSAVQTIKYCEGCCVKMVTNRNTPRQVVRRTCTKDIDINLFIVDHVCMDASDGKGHMCFCETNLCNAARNPHSAAASSLWMFISFVVLLLPLFTPNQASQSIESNRIDRNHF